MDQSASDTGQISVMQLISNLDVAGAQEVVCTLAQHLPAYGCKPVVCTLRDGPLRHDIEAAGIGVDVIPGRRYGILALPWFIMDMIVIGQALKESFRRHRVDVVQTHLLGILDFLVLILCYSERRRVALWTFHNVHFELASRLAKSHATLGFGARRTWCVVFCTA
jgi:hypothetical protein